jgi:radical SAM superfamily enzyme YgiQ (UPF0313 family)
LLVHPEFPDTFWSFKHALKFVRKRAALPPLGLLTVAGMLPDRWEKRLVDVNARGLTRADLEWADVVLIGAMLVQRDSALEIVARCHEAGVPVVAGGPLFTAEHAQFPTVDHFVLGEAELTLANFIADFESGRARRLYRADGFADLHATPAPLWEIVDLGAYYSMSVQYSRGCPYDCEFCNVTALFGHLPRTKSPQQVISELDGLWDQGWHGPVFFVDDNLIGNKRDLKTRLLPALAEWRRGKRGVSFYTEASINLADDDDLMRLMVEAGFDMVFVGIETPEEAGLAECNKKQNQNRDLVADVKRIQRAGMQVQGGFIVGFDSDTPQVFERQIRFIQQSGIVTAMVGLLTALPDTRLYRRLQLEGRLLGESTGDNVDGVLNFLPRMDSAVLREGYHELLERIYAPRIYYRRVRTLLREYRTPSTRLPIRVGDLRTFARAALRLGLVGRERFQFWWLVTWTMLRRPGLLRLAVTLAISGHHLRLTAMRTAGV